MDNKCPSEPPALFHVLERRPKQLESPVRRTSIYLMNKAAANSPTLNTAFLLMAQYGGKAVIPVEDVCRDYFSHLDPAKFNRKVGAGEIAIPLVRMEPSQKCAKGVHLQDLADYLDARRAAALKEYRQLAS
jgi:hypothetical protein